jgi:hypothetical protein
MAWTTPGTATAGEVLTAAFWNTNVRDNSNALSRGVIAVATRTTSQGSITSIVDLTDMTLTITAEANRRYLVTGYSTAISSVAGDYINMDIYASGNFKQRAGDISTTNAVSVSLFAMYYDVPGAGSITYKLRMFRTGTGTVTANPETAQMFITVIDAGSTI